MALLCARAGVAQSGNTVLIRNATVLTITGGTLEGGSVLVRAGKIAAVGKGLAAPADAEVVDGTGMYLMPGIIDCHSHIAVSGGVNEGTLSVTSMVGVGDALNPEDIDIYRDLAGGVTTANVLHGSANSIGGKNQVIKLRWGKDADGLRFSGAPPGIKFALGENPKRGGGSTTGTPRYPATRMGVEDVVRDAFTRAREYGRAWDEYRDKQAKGLTSYPPRRDLELEPLLEVLRGQRKVHCHCYRSDEILMLIRIADEFGFKIATFQHVLEGYKVAKEIARHGAGGSTFSDWWSYKVEAYDAIPYNAAIMTRAGVSVSINSDSAEEARHLNQEAAKCIKYGGLTELEALKLVTLNPARQLGIDPWVGSIEVGKDADLVLYNRHPLSTMAMPQKVWIDGQLYFDRQRDKERQKQIEEQKRKLRAEEPAAVGSGVRQGAPPAPRISGGEQATQSTSSTSDRLSSASSASSAVNSFPRGTLAITNARIYPVSGPVIERGTVVVKDGYIQAVGAGVKVPVAATVIDAKGLRLYPGMIDADTNMGLEEIQSVRETNDATELGDFNPQLRAFDAIHPESEHIPVTRVAGITTVLSRPTGSIFSGQAAIINLDGWTTAEMALVQNAGIAASIPYPSAGREFDIATLSVRTRPYSAARQEADTRLKRITDLLAEARHYLAARAARDKDPSLPFVKRDEKFEALAPLLNRQVPLLAEADSRAGIRSAVEFAEKEKLQVVILGGSEAGKMAPYLKQHDVPVIFGPVQSLPDDEDDPYDLPYSTPGILAKAGVRFALTAGAGSMAPSFVRTLPFEAGTAAGNGLSEEEALKAVTLYPAQILGLGGRLGSIAPGKIANLVLADGDLLELRTNVKQVFIAGRAISMESRHTQLWEKYRNRP